MEMSIKELLESERSQIKLALRELRKKRTILERARKKFIAKSERLQRKVAKLTKRTGKVGRPPKKR